MNWNFLEGCNLLSYVYFAEPAVGLHKKNDSHITFKKMAIWMKYKILEFC